MSINFANVKAITIPEGDVVKITINNVDVWVGKLEASIPGSDWYVRSNNYYATQNRAFMHLIEDNNSTSSTSVNTKLTITVYNPTEDASYDTSVNITLALVNDGWYKSQSFNVRYNANNSKYRFNSFRVYRTGGNMGYRQTELYPYSSWNSTTSNCVITNVTLEVLSYN